jgi:DNA-binding NarL/FixJ family response regulator
MSKTVMIVEDNELNMKLFHGLLEAHGYRTIGTCDGFKVPDLARKHRRDLILMDIQLPEISGLEVTQLIAIAVLPRLSEVGDLNWFSRLGKRSKEHGEAHSAPPYFDVFRR